MPLRRGRLAIFVPIGQIGAQCRPPLSRQHHTIVITQIFAGKCPEKFRESLAQNSYIIRRNGVIRAGKQKYPMKTMKLALAALAAFFISTSNSPANHRMAEMRTNANGQTFWVYTSKPKTTTVAVYAHGRGLQGDRVSHSDRASHTHRDVIIPQGRGNRLQVRQSGH